MKNKLLLLFMALLDSIHLSGQTPDTTNRNLLVKIAPIALLDPYSGSSIRLGAEHKIKNNKAIYLELGAFLPNSIYNSKSVKNNAGFTIKSELKHYLYNQNCNSGVYCSFELNYKYQSYITSDSIQLQNTYLKTYPVKKHVFSALVNFGEIFIAKCGFIIDINVGLGIRYKNVKSSLNNHENDNVIKVGDYGTNIMANQSGSFFYPDINMGIRIGYCIKYKKN
jgi:hypothetical protein